MILTALLTAGVLWAGMRLAGVRDASAAISGALMALAAGAGVAGWVFRRSLATRPGQPGPAALVSAGVRFVVAVSVALILVTRGGFPPAATLLCLVPLYVAVMGVEAHFLVAALWKQPRR